MAYRLYQTKDGDMIDLIAWQHYGKSSGFVEKMLEVNRGDRAHALSSKPLVLPRGLNILLPEATEEPRRIISLYD
jgi:phage tail protein X